MTAIRALVISLMLSPPMLVAQFTPVTAHVTQLVQITKDGKLVETHNRTGNYYRSSNGSQLYRWETDDGKATYQGSLNDNATGTAYQLDFRSARAIQGGQGKPLPPDALRWDKVGDRPRDSVEGISCVVYSRSNQRECWSVDHLLMLWTEMSFPMKSDPSETYHLTSRMSDIKLNAQVDERLFDVHQSFTVLKPEEPKR